MLQYNLEYRIDGTLFKSGNIYRFDYRNYKNDPNPLIICLGVYNGFNPKTGNPWHFISAININYLPRKDRRILAQDWENVHKRTNKRIRMTWDIIKKSYPYLAFGIRRYLYSPGYMIQNSQEIPSNNFDKEIVQDFWKDYSDQIRKNIMTSLKKKRGF